MELAGEDQHANARQHAVDNRWRHGPEPLPQAQHARQDLHRPGGEHDHAQALQAKLLNDLVDDHRQAGGRAADLQWRSSQHSHHQPTDDSGDQAGGHRRARGNGHAHAQGQSHQKHDDRSGQIVL
jgi:hypothetical protein